MNKTKGGGKLTEKERKKVKESEIGYFLDAMIDPGVSQEEINNSNPRSSLGAVLKDIAVDYRELTGGGQSLPFLLSELDKKADKDDIVDPTWGQITGSLSNQIDLKNALSDKASVSDLAAIETRTRNLESSKANTVDVESALDLKADKDDIVDPTWGQITGSLPNQIDLKNALSGKASVSDLAAIDTRTRNLESSKANTVDVESALDLKADKTDVAQKADTLYVNTMVSDKADKQYVDTMMAAKANAADVVLKADKTYVDSVVASKASVALWDSIEIPADGWSSSAPYMQTVDATGMTAASFPNIDIKFNNNATIEIEKTYYNCVDRITTGADTLTLVCSKEKPAGTFYIKVKEVG